MPARTARPGRRGRLVAVSAAGVALASGVLFVATRSDSGRDLRAGSEVLEDAEPALFDVVDPPQSYRIDYRVESFAGDDPVVTADRLWVRRPFASRLESYDGPEIEGDPSSVEVSSFGALRVEGTGSTPAVRAAPPGPPISDVALAVALPDALDDGRLELRERREVNGRPCQVIRTAVLLTSGELGPPTDDEHADTCIDGRGLVLEDLLVSGGRPLLRRLAVDVEIDPRLEGVSFETGEPTVAPRDGGGFVAELVPGSRQPGTFYEAEVPDGFERLGRYVVIPPQHENFTDPTRRGHRLTYVSDVFADAGSVVVLDQGGTFGGVDPFPGLEGEEVVVDGLGVGILTYRHGGPVLVVPREGGKFVRARGGVPTGVLIDLLERLDQVDGGELTLLEGG